MSFASEVSSAGQTIYLHNCQMCHGKTGKGDGPAAAAMKSHKPKDLKSGKFLLGDDLDSIIATISNGVPNTPMPAWKSELSKKEIEMVSKYVISLRKQR